MVATNDSARPNSNRFAGARVCALALAVALGVVAYRNHFVIPQLPWWGWIAPLLAGAVMLTLAFGGAPTPAESRARRAIRWAAGTATVLAIGVVIDWLPHLGWEVPIAIAAFIALATFFVARWTPFAPDDVENLLPALADPPPTTVTRVRMVVLTLASLCAGVAAVRLNPTNHLAAFLVWLLSLALFAAAMWRRVPAPARADRWIASGGPELSPRSAALALLLVLLLALALRVTFLRDVPGLIDPDEGRQGRWAERIWADGFPDAFGLGWNVFPHLSYMVEYVWVQALGTSNPHLRLSAATIGTLSLVPVFFWVRRWWGNVIAVLAVLILATNREHIIWSRLALNNIQQVLVAGLILAAFARVLRTRRAIDWVWFGYSVGLAFHTYHSAKLFPALLALVAVVLAIGIAGLWRRYAAGALIGALAALLCFGPLAATIYQSWGYFYNGTSNRVDLAQLTDAYHRGDVGQVRDYIGRHVVGCLLSFISIPPERYGPTFDPFVAVPFLLGVGWMLWRWRDPRHLVVIVWTAGILAIGGMITDYPPWKPRLLGLLPTVCLIPAVVAGRARALLLRWWARSDLIAVPLLVAWLAASLQYNWYSTFVALPQAQRGDVMTEICRVVEDAPTPTTIYMVGGAIMAEPKVASNDCMIAANPNRVLVDLAADSTVVPIPPTNRGAAIVLVSALQQELVPLVQHYYPEARYDIMHEPHYGSAALHIFRLDAEVIERARGLRGTFTSPRRTWTAMIGADNFVAPPDATAADFPLSASWRGVWWAEVPGAYAFNTPGTLRVDGRVIANDAAVTLAAGWHAIDLSAALHASGETIALRWRDPTHDQFVPVPRAVLHTHPHAHGLLGRYYSRAVDEPPPTVIAAQPDYTRIDGAISFDFYRQFDETPTPSFAAVPSTMEWVGTVGIDDDIAPALRLEATTPSQVFLNETLVVESSRDAQPVTVELSGVHGRIPIRIRTLRPADDRNEFWKLRVLWRTAGGDWTAFADYRRREDG